MKLQTIIDKIEELAPLPLQESFDNCGLLIGRRDAEITGALVCLDVSEAVIREAIALGYNLVISHHPIIFHGLKSLTESNEVERCVALAIKNDVALYASHTCMDSATGGVNFRMAQKIGLADVQVLVPQREKLLKLVTFVPQAQLETVRTALFAAGAGHIGNYDACSYASEGHGTFRASEGCHPFCGEIGELHTEPEVRLEVILPTFRQSAVVHALLQSHPYEEPAFDLIPLANAWPSVGLGAVGNLPEPMDEKDFLSQLKQIFHVDCIKHSALLGKKISRVALCGGSGAEFIGNAKAAGADVFVTADVSYHRFFEADGALLIADIGHFESEQFTKEIFFELISKNFANFAVQMSKTEPKRVFAF